MATQCLCSAQQLCRCVEHGNGVGHRETGGPAAQAHEGVTRVQRLPAFPKADSSLHSGAGTPTAGRKKKLRGKGPCPLP